jgi:hypothetical protein
MKLLGIILIIFCALQGVSQDSTKRKGNIYLLWGYNRAAYLPSDIHFQGDNYDFTLYDVRAKDFPSQFDPKVYFGLVSFTIPQYNYRVGYFVNDRLSLSVGLDHMKYVLRGGQSVYMDGNFENTNTQYEGVYDDVYLPLSSDLVTLNHTDGFNYVSLELDYHKAIWKSKNAKHGCDLFAGMGFGLMVPRSDVTVLGEKAANEFHVAGEAISIQTGFKAKFFNHIAVNTTVKTGISRMHNILTTESRAKASQNIGWIQSFWQVGYVGRLAK